MRAGYVLSMLFGLLLLVAVLFSGVKAWYKL